MSEAEIRRAYEQYISGARTSTELAARYYISRSTLLRYFDRAGLHGRRGRPRLLSEEQIARAYERYLGGESIMKLALEYYVCPRTLSGYIRKACGADALRARPRAYAIDRETVRELYRERLRRGTSLRKLGARVGHSDNAVRSAFKRYGLEGTGEKDGL